MAKSSMISLVSNSAGPSKYFRLGRCLILSRCCCSSSHLSLRIQLQLPQQLSQELLWLLVVESLFDYLVMERFHLAFYHLLQQLLVILLRRRRLDSLPPQDRHDGESSQSIARNSSRASLFLTRSDMYGSFKLCGVLGEVC